MAALLAVFVLQCTASPPDTPVLCLTDAICWQDHFFRKMQYYQHGNLDSVVDHTATLLMRAEIADLIADNNRMRMLAHSMLGKI